MRTPQNIWVRLRGGPDAEFNVHLSDEEVQEISRTLSKDKDVSDFSIGSLYVGLDGSTDFLEELGAFKANELE